MTTTELPILIDDDIAAALVGAVADLLAHSFWERPENSPSSAWVEHFVTIDVKLLDAKIVKLATDGYRAVVSVELGQSSRPLTGWKAEEMAGVKTFVLAPSSKGFDRWTVVGKWYGVRKGLNGVIKTELENGERAMAEQDAIPMARRIATPANPREDLVRLGAIEPLEVNVGDVVWLHAYQGRRAGVVSWVAANGKSAAVVFCTPSALDYPHETKVSLSKLLVLPS